LRIDWNTVPPADRAAFVFGNPSFVGMYVMTSEQNDDNDRVANPTLHMERVGV
jgi:hypothetical protein